LEGWQAFIVWNLFGWKKRNKKGKWVRRYKKAYIQIARKNGKSTFASAIGLYMLLMDGEAGAQVYTGAPAMKQAQIAFKTARQMVKQSKALKQLCKAWKTSIECERLNATFQPLAYNPDKQDGFNPNCSVIDEYHAHPDDKLYAIMNTAMGSRPNPLMFIITTAGYNKMGPCFNMRKMCIDILDEVAELDELFCMIYELDEEDYEDGSEGWKNPKNWIKANPSMSSIDTLEDYLDEQFREAVLFGGNKIVDFLTKNLNIFVDAAAVWVKSDIVKLNRLELIPEHLKGRRCYGGLDLATVSDMSSFCLIFPPVKTGERWAALWWFWLPKLILTEDEQQKYRGIDIRKWVDNGWLELTEGNITDYDVIRRRISGLYVHDGKEKEDENCIMKLFDIESVSYDQYNSSQLVNNLINDGLEMNSLSMTYSKLAAPFASIERKLKRNEWNIGQNPVIYWQIMNVNTVSDSGGNVKPDKDKKKSPIDGVISWTCAEAEYLDKNPDGELTEDEMMPIFPD